MLVGGGKITMKAVIIGFASSLVLMSGAVSADPVPAAGGDSPLFREMFAAILENTGLETNLIAAPPERRRRMFAQGRVVLDCCATEAWRQREEELAVQLWSTPFFVNRDRFVVHEESTIIITKPEDLKQYRVAVVHGFDYAHSSHFGMSVPGRGWDAVLQLIEKKRADIGIIGEVVFNESQLTKRRALRMIEVAEEQALSIRVHRSRADLLPVINQSIMNLKAQKAFLTIANLVPE